jgi:hypothetical protein
MPEVIPMLAPSNRVRQACGAIAMTTVVDRSVQAIEHAQTDVALVD